MTHSRIISATGQDQLYSAETGFTVDYLREIVIEYEPPRSACAPLESTALTTKTPARQKINTITERIMEFSLVVYALFAPHSIAITQGSFLLGLLAWGVQLTASRQFRQRRTPIDIAIFGFFACCVFSSFLSYDPLVSIKGLRSPAFFLAFYFVSTKISSLRRAKFLATAVVLSCVFNVVYSAGQLWKGRGIQIDSIAADSPLLGSTLEVGDIILEADGKPVKSIEDLSRIVDQNRGRLSIVFQRKEAVSMTTISRRAVRGSLGEGATRLGITVSPGRNLRVTGLYNHYETYAEVLQMIASLGIGLLMAQRRRRSGLVLPLCIALPLIMIALIMTSTRAAVAGLVVSVLTMSIVAFGRRAVQIVIPAVLLLVAGAAFFIQSSRGISFIDLQEGSTSYRLTVWSEAMALVKSHPLLGIGKGTEGSEQFRKRFGLYDNNRLPPGHFHSTPVQIATWWGLAALAFYFVLMTIMILECWKLAGLARARAHWDSWGIAVGVLGALVAFNIASLAHFNFGDGEVVMALWLLAGLAFAVRRLEMEELPAHKRKETAEDTRDRSQLRRPEETSESSAQVATATRG